MFSFTRTKYIIYAILGLIVLGAVAFVLYGYFFAPGTPLSPTGQQPGVSGGFGGGPGGGAPAGAPPAPATPPLPNLPSITEQRLVRLTDFSVVSPSLNPAENRVMFYKKDGGDLFSIPFQGGAPEKTAPVTVVGLMEAIWSRGRDRAAVFYLGDETIKGFLHIGTSSIAVLPPEIKSFSWSPDGKSIAYLALKDDLANLVIADSSGRNPKTVFRTAIADAQISWISSDKIAFQTAASGLAEGFIFVFSRATGAFAKMFGPSFGLQSLWSPDGSRILISRADRERMSIASGIFDAAKKQYRALDIATVDEKCVWSDGKEIYCAVPRDIPPQTVMPDDYLRGEYNSSDWIARIDANTGQTQKIFEEGAFDMSSILTTKDKKYLFFVNRIDGTLWSLKLQ